MRIHSTISWKKIKHGLYLFTLLLLTGFSLLIFFQSLANFKNLDYLNQQLQKFHLSALILLGAAAFVSLFLFFGNKLSEFSERKQLHLTVSLAVIAVFVQYFLLFQFQAVLRYDHMRVLDGALEIIQNGHLSLTDNNGYFGFYPFNISIAAFHSMILRVVMFFGIPEKFYLLSLQCVYLFLIDLGIYFSWHLVKTLYSIKHATLFAILCIVNPILYVCAAGCYTTTLMLPLLMATLDCMICFLKEPSFHKKCFLGFLSGVLLAFGSRLRATIFIAGIALLIFLILHKNSENIFKNQTKRIAILACAFLIGGVSSFGGYTAYQNTYITEDYTDTQMPILYYLMFSMNPFTAGSYSEGDFHMISQYPTLEQKNEESLKVIKERLSGYGIRGTISLAKEKLRKTWSDGQEDYYDFLTTSRNYSKLHSYFIGEQKEFFALYAHVYHVAIVGMFFLAVLFSLKQKCDSSSYLILLTLLGGILFHIIWEAYDIYSFGFSMLFVIPAAERITYLSEKKEFVPRYALASLTSLIAFAALFAPSVKKLFQTEIHYNEYAVVQDMSLGDFKPLFNGDIITQTFQTDRPFNRLGCRVYNIFGNYNESIYQIELISQDGTTLSSRDFIGAEMADQGYVFTEFDDVVPNGMETYRIVITPLHTTDTSYLTFGYYNTHHYDIYSDGFMTGLNSDEKTDLDFTVFLKTSSMFFDNH